MKIHTDIRDSTSGGRGKKALYDTKQMRVPVPLAGIIKQLTWLYVNHGIEIQDSDIWHDDGIFSDPKYVTALKESLGL